MQSTFFFKGKDGKVICKTDFGKISFVDSSYKGQMPRDGEKWQVEIKKEFGKFNIIEPLFVISGETLPPLEKLEKAGYYLGLDFFTSEIIVIVEGKKFRYPYDGRWNDKKFFYDHSFAEAIRLHKLSKSWLESGMAVIMIDETGKLVFMSPSNIGENVAEYASFCHIMEVDGGEKNYVFINQEAEDKFNKLLERYKNTVYSGKPLPVDYWNAYKVARAIGVSERTEIKILVAVDDEKNVAYEDKYIIGEVETIKTSNKTEWIMHVFEVKQKCMIPEFFVTFPTQPKSRWETPTEPPLIPIKNIDLKKTKFGNFSEAEQYVCGWLPRKFFYQTKEGMSMKVIHKKICDYLADMGEYFLDDIPISKSETKDILGSMIGNNYLDYLPTDREIGSLYLFFKSDWKREGGDLKKFPSEEEWKSK